MRKPRGLNVAERARIFYSMTRAEILASFVDSGVGGGLKKQESSARDLDWCEWRRLDHAKIPNSTVLLESDGVLGGGAVVRSPVGHL